MPSVSASSRSRLMAPAAYHRIVFGGEEDEAMHRVGSVMLTAATLPLVMGLAGDIYVVIAKIAASPAAALLLLVGLWHVLPLVMRTRGTKPAESAAAGDRAETARQGILRTSRRQGR
jgi:hypothetical protein